MPVSHSDWQDASVTFQLAGSQYHIPTGRMPVSHSDWQDASITFQLAGCQYHIPTGRMPVSHTDWQDASITFQLAGCQYHTPTGRMPVSHSNWQDAGVTFRLAGCQYHIPTGRMPVSWRLNPTSRLQIEPVRLHAEIREQALPPAPLFHGPSSRVRFARNADAQSARWWWKEGEWFPLESQ